MITLVTILIILFTVITIYFLIVIDVIKHVYGNVFLKPEHKEILSEFLNTPNMVQDKNMGYFGPVYELKYVSKCERGFYYSDLKEECKFFIGFWNPEYKELEKISKKLPFDLEESVNIEEYKKYLKKLEKTCNK